MRGIVAALVIAVAACGEQQSAAEAARADSSAAGYAVGPHDDRTAVAGGKSGSMPASPLPDDRATTVAASPAAASSTTARATASTVVTSKPAGGKAGAASTGGGRTTAAAAPPDTSPNATTAGAGEHGADSSAGTASTAGAAGPVRVNEFLTYDQRSRTVSLQLVAGYNGLNGSLNYNGATRGNHGVYVPLGWRVHVAVTNHDSDLQHSAIVLEKVLPPPIEPTVPAFDGAALPQLDEGLAEDDIGTLDFVANRVGQYMIACGVPGHAQAGMWFQLAVLKGIAVPVYR